MKQKLRLQKFCDFEQGQPTLALAERIGLDLSVPIQMLQRGLYVVQWWDSFPQLLQPSLVNWEKFGFWQSSYTRTSPGRPGRVFLVCENCEKISHCEKQSLLGHNITSLLRSHPHDVTVWSPRDSNRRDSGCVRYLEFICRGSNLLDYWEWIWFNLFILN